MIVRTSHDGHDSGPVRFHPEYEEMHNMWKEIAKLQREENSGDSPAPPVISAAKAGAPPPRQAAAHQVHKIPRWMQLRNAVEDTKREREQQHELAMQQPRGSSWKPAWMEDTADNHTHSFNSRSWQDDSWRSTQDDDHYSQWDTVAWHSSRHSQDDTWREPMSTQGSSWYEQEGGRWWQKRSYSDAQQEWNWHHH